MTEKFDPLILDPWIQSLSSPSQTPEELEVWTREEVISKSNECGIFGHLLKEEEKKNIANDKKTSQSYENIIALIQYYQSRDKPLYNAFYKGLSLSDIMTIFRENCDGEESMVMRGEVKFHKLLVHGICRNLDQPGFGNFFSPVKLKINFNLDSLSGNRIRKFMFKAGNLLALLEILREDISATAPHPNISYSNENGNGPIIPVRYHIHRKDSKSEAFFPQLRSWLEADENLFAFPEENGCDETVITTLIDMLSTAATHISEDAKVRTRLESSGFFDISYLYVVNPEKQKFTGLGYVKCTKPSCNNKGVKKCSSCNSPYCSVECQKSHWKEHKPACKAILALSHDESINSRTSVLVTLDDDWMKDKSDMHSFSFSTNGNGFYKNKPGKSTKLKHLEGEFIIKMQGNMSPHCIFRFYDEYRRIDNMVKATTTPGKRIYQTLLRIPNPYPGMSQYHALQKCFLYARTEVNGTRVFLDKLAPWQKW